MTETEAADAAHGQPERLADTPPHIEGSPAIRTSLATYTKRCRSVFEF